MKTIFIVDDSDTNLAAAEEALEDYYNVMTIPSAAKMFKMLERIKPDMILLDIEMPEINGYEAMEKLKNSSSWADIPVIFLTGTIDYLIEEHCLKLGAVSVILKPFSVQGLLDNINSNIT